MAITAQINVTPDGFCNHDDVVIDDDFMKFAVDIIEKAERLVLGRKTYELFKEHWPAAAKNPSEPRQGDQWNRKDRDLLDTLILRLGGHDVLANDRRRSRRHASIGTGRSRAGQPIHYQSIPPPGNTERTPSFYTPCHGWFRRAVVRWTSDGQDGIS